MKEKESSESQQKLYKIMAVPTATCGSEALFVRKNRETKIEQR
jgi:hypothetical protein